MDNNLNFENTMNNEDSNAGFDPPCECGEFETCNICSPQIIEMQPSNKKKRKAPPVLQSASNVFKSREDNLQSPFSSQGQQNNFFKNTDKLPPINQVKVAFEEDKDSYSPLQFTSSMIGVKQNTVIEKKPTPVVKAQVTKFNQEAAGDYDVIDLNKKEASENLCMTKVCGNKRSKGIKDKTSLPQDTRKKQLDRRSKTQDELPSLFKSSIGAQDQQNQKSSQNDDKSFESFSSESQSEYSDKFEEMKKSQKILSQSSKSVPESLKSQINYTSDGSETFQDETAQQIQPNQIMGYTQDKVKGLLQQAKLNIFSREAQKKKIRQQIQKNLSKRTKQQRNKGKTQLLRQSKSWGFIDLDDPKQLQQTAAHRFGTYQNHFAHMSQRQKIATEQSINSIIISNDDQLAISVTQNDYNECFVTTYDLMYDDYKNVEITFKISGPRVVKAQSVVQDTKGQFFCLPYFNSGMYMLRVFSRENDCLDDFIDINLQLGISQNQRYVTDFDFPSITATFINEDVLFVNLFDNILLNHWSFKYNYKTQRVTQKYQRKMGTSHENFIMVCLADIERNIYHVLYRHGQCITINCANEDKNCIESIQRDDQDEMRTQIQQVSRIGIGNAYLINPKCMVFRHSTEVLFFRRELSQDPQRERQHHHNFYEWINHFTLAEECQIFNASSSNDIIITTEKKIFYYKLDENQMPVLTSIVFNFMGCSYFIQSLSKEIYISYSAGQEDFTVFTRKNYHTFKVPIDFKNHRYSTAERLMNANAYCISDRNTITIYKQKNSSNIRRITIEVFKDEQNKALCPEQDYFNSQQILNMKVSESEKTLVVLNGNIEENRQSKVHYIFVFTLNYHEIYQKNKNIQDVQQTHTIHLPNELNDISILFEFANPKRKDAEPHQIFLIDENEIYLYDFTQGFLRRFFNFPKTYDFSLQRKPEQFVINQSQTIAFIQAQGDILLVDLVKKQKIELDDKFQIGDIKACKNAYEHFFIICNKRLKQKGIFLLRIKEKDFDKIHDESYTEEEAANCFLLKWSTQLEIGDVDIYTVEDNMNRNFYDKTENMGIGAKPTKFDHRELIISYKSIYINTYDIIVIKLNDGSLIFKHESFHLWEQHIKGIFISQHQFLTISQAGVHAQSLARKSTNQDRKKNTMVFKDPNNNKIERRLHSLQEADYLKLSPKNHIVFKNSSDQNKIQINIRGQYTHKRSGHTLFQNLYSILIEEMNLWEILVFQGIFCCASQDEMAKMIKQLPDSGILFKSYLELDMANLVTILSFDSETVGALLSPQNIEKIDKNYPIFYNIKRKRHVSKDNVSISRETAVDIALRNNQTSALNHIIGYIVKYQNSYVYSYFFKQNLTKLLEKGIYVKDLLNSQIIAPVIDFDENEWPTTHTDNTKIIKPFNGSVFKIRSQYDQIFKALAKDEIKQQKARQDPLEKIYKIKYTVNFLPLMDFNDEFGDLDYGESLMELLGETEQIEIFQTKAIQDFIEYKWVKYGKWVHYISATFHIVYILSFFYYLNEKYLLRHERLQIPSLSLMCICNSYGMFYDMTQWKKQGRMYLTDPWNINDQFFIWTGFVNLYFQFDFDNKKVHFKPQGQLIMIFFVIFMLIKTFFFLRIFETFTKLVIMIKNVFYDLKVFIWFYILLLTMFSVILGVLGVGNYRAIDDEDLKEIMRSAQETGNNHGEEFPGYEYGQMTEFMKNIFTILRFSLGDFNFSLTNHLSEFERVIFWITWVIIVIMTCVIFLNFIIAEVSQSYQTVNNDVKELVLKEKAKMINESEDMLTKHWKGNDEMFPKYLVIREVEE